MVVRNHKDLAVWQKAMSLVTDIYSLTGTFPREEIYGLTAQMRRAAISIPSNIAEGRGKRSTKDFMRYLNIAYGSLAELETQILIAGNLKFLNSEETASFSGRIGELNRMINAMLAKLGEKLDYPKC